MNQAALDASEKAAAPIQWVGDPIFRNQGSVPVVRSVLKRLPAIGVLAFITYLHCFIGRGFTFNPIDFDEQWFLSEGFSLGKGLVPYRDFQEFKPPMVFVVNMLAIKIFGVADMRFRHFFTLLSLLGFLAVAVALLSRRIAPLIVAGLHTTMVNHFWDEAYHQTAAINDAESPGVVFFMLGVGILLFRTRRTRLQQISGGAVLALSPLSKEPFALPVLFAWLSLLLLHRSESPSPQAWRGFAKHTIVGAASVAMVWLGYMLLTRSLGWYLLELKETFLYAQEHNVKYGVFPRLPFWETCVEGWKKIRGMYVNPTRMTIFIPYFAAALLLWRRSAMLMALTVPLTFVAGLVAVSVGRGFFPHYFIIGMAGTFFFGIMGAVAFGQLCRMGARHHHWASAVLSVMGLCAVSTRYGVISDAWATYRPVDPPVSKELLALIEQHSKKEDKIWNIGRPAVHVYSNRVTASRIAYMHDSLLYLYPGETDAERFAPYREELDAKMPKLVILGEGREGRERHMDGLVQPFLDAHGYQKLDGAEVPVYERPY